ncbi:DMT family transporter [Fusobacterium massiliense]|uniref:DMT family transporter n=1 Tax=Fusobacterium massiliense TaxID=1852365 RepID=UPI00093ED52F|nr:DMT family transporter [Fusobacterium massiliense]
MNKTERIGIINTFVGGTLWGINGVMGSYLFLNKAVTTNWLVPYRLLIAGLILLSYLYYKNGKKVFDILKNGKDLLSIVIFGIFGMMGTQYTYFTAIEYSNAAIATVLTYFGPTLVLVYVCMREARRPLKYEIFSIVLSMFGVFLLATHGNFSGLQISFKALFWGMLSAMTLVVYTIQPEKILKKYGTTAVVAWGMFIGGIISIFMFNPWKVDVIFDFTTFIFFIIIIFSGTIAAFVLYLTGVTMIGPTKASIIACVEPVSATIFSIIFMGVTFGFLDIIGFICVISTIFIVAIFDKKEVKKKVK